MKSCEIAVIRVRPDGRLLVSPILPPEQDFELVQRDDMQVSWDADSRAFLSADPQSWDPVDWLRQILGAARDECGVLLRATDKTTWMGLPEADRKAMELLFKRESGG